MLEDIPIRYSNKTSVHLIETKNKTKVPIFYLQYAQAKHTILYSHGNATDCGGMLPLYEMLAMALRVNVVAYDYTGYGVSKHFGIAPTEKQTYQDIETVYQWIVDQKIVQDARKELIVYGQSVGSGPSCFLASLTGKAQKPIAGLILHSPIMSGLRVLTESRVLGCFDIFPNIDRIGKVNVPVMILHGEADEEVDVMHGKRLHAAGNQAKPQSNLYYLIYIYISIFISTIHCAVKESCRYDPWWVEKRGHNDILLGHEQQYLK
jgi:pimeloyl-ACP methyl ester carboxylesterase